MMITKYDTPKIGVFSVEMDPPKWDDALMEWKHREISETIIGENEYWYVSKTKLSSHGVWIGNIVFTKYYILEIGIHKTRLVKWL